MDDSDASSTTNDTYSVVDDDDLQVNDYQER